MILKTNVGRGVRLALGVALAGLGAAFVLFLSSAHAGRAQASVMTQPKVSAKVVAFRSAMDRLWEDHIVWTRMVIVDFAAGLPDLKTAEARLLRNQADIGNAIKPYYGRAAGKTLTSLLRTHILEAVPVLQAAKAGDKTSLTRALAAWNANAHEIAVFLSRANPRNWPLAMRTTLGCWMIWMGVSDASSSLASDLRAVHRSMPR